MPPVKRLVDLPRELLELVYDRLEVADRIRLNMSLPKGFAVTKTTRTSTSNDTKLAVVCMFLKRRAHLLGSLEVKVEDMSPVMCKFFRNNLQDPTMIRIANEMPQVVPALLPMRGRWLFDLVNVIQQKRPVDAEKIAWADFEDTIEDVVQAVIVNGTPDMFDGFMAYKNCFQAHVLQHFSSFVFGLVNYGNNSLLSHLMQMGEHTDFSVLIQASRAYLTRFKLLNIFIMSEGKVKSIVECVGVEMSVLQELLEEASRRMVMPMVMYLLKIGVRL